MQLDQKSKEEVINNCNHGIGKECYRLSIGLYHEGDLTTSITTSQQACSSGIKSACDFSKQVMQEKISNEKNRQETMRALLVSPPLARPFYSNPMLPTLYYLNKAWSGQNVQPTPNQLIRCNSRQRTGAFGSELEADCQ